MAIRVRPFHLAAAISLTLLHLFAGAITPEHLLLPDVVSAMAVQDATASPRAAVVSSRRLPFREPVFFSRLHAPPSPSSSVAGDLSSLRLTPSTVYISRQDQDTTAPLRVDPPCGCVAHNHAPTVLCISSTPRHITAPATSKALVDALALPLLAVPFLPPPVVAALVALSYLAAPVRAWPDIPKLTHASCAVYSYDNETDTIDRRRPDPSLNAECEHPLCRASTYKRAVLHAQPHGRGDDPLLIYCTVRVLQGPASILPWSNVWLTHMPVADPAAVAASGDRVCYVELTHLGYREGYYIRCPNSYSDRRHSACAEMPEEEVAAAVWEHRRLNYRDTVWPRYPPAADADA